MTAKQRRLAVITASAFGLILMGLGVLFLVLGLAKADQAGSVVGAIASVLGLALSVLGLIAARQDPAPAAQRVDRVESGADLDLIDGVAGSVRLGAQRPATTGLPAAVPPPAGEQVVTNTKTTGSIRIVRGVAGDLDINP